MSNKLTRILLGISLSALSAGMLTLAFPPFDLWFLAWIAMVPALLAQFRIFPSSLSSLAAAVFNGGWLWGYLGPVFAGSGTFMTYLPAIVFAIALMTERGTRTFHRRTRYRWFVLYGIANWVGIEMIRIFLPIAGTWGFIAYTQHRLPWLIQPVSLFGIFGMSALLVLVNYVLGMVAIQAFDRRWSLEDAPVRVDVRGVRRWSVGAGATLVAWAVLSLLLFSQPTAPTVRVAAVQPGASVISAAFGGLEERVAALTERMSEQTRMAAGEGARFVVWPEGALSFDPQEEDRLDLRGLTAETGAHLAVGYAIVLDEGLRNEATVINPQGDFLGTFGKDHPVTFGGETSLTRGTYPVYDTPLGKLGTIICYDLDFTDTARKLARQGAQLIAVPSNDWSAITYKHYTHLVFRAVENRVTMVKADAGFDSAVIDPYGRVVALATEPEGGEATLVVNVPLGSGEGTLNSHLGDWFGWLCLAGLAFFTVGGSWLVSRGSHLARAEHHHSEKGK
jgi:apolipoprotein N-acyltransferase